MFVCLFVCLNLYDRRCLGTRTTSQFKAFGLKRNYLWDSRNDYVTIGFIAIDFAAICHLGLRGPGGGERPNSLV